jgi:regulator of sirC expression with transglutaminase-like and TPR domain
VDEDLSVYQSVRKEILAYGPEATQWLRPCQLSADPILRRRAREIIRHFDKQEADTRFLSFCLRHGEDFDLEKAAWLFARTEYPDINIEGYEALLDNYASELRERIAPDADADQTLRAINKYLFKELGYAGNQAHFSDPENGYLNRVIDRRTGNTLNLSLLYLLVTRRLQLPVIGIGLPGHFVCRYQSSSNELYVDAFNRGQILTKADCVQFLLNGNHSLGAEFLTPVSARRLFMRICSNLQHNYIQLGRNAKSAQLQHYLVALGR